MNRILYIPLDERPCNYNFPIFLAQDTEYEIIVPPIEFLGHKKFPADLTRLNNWLTENISDCAVAIISIDMLLYGGIVPSRLHHYDFNTCCKRLKLLSELKNINKKLEIFAFNLIMRCPKYSSCDEEPDYYENFGKDIFYRKYIEHKNELEIVDNEELNVYKKINIPPEIIKDFENRREINKQINIKVLSLVEDEIIDFLIIPQDDSSPYGYTAKDQQDIRKEIKKLSIQTKALMYPGADEVGCTLLARYINKSKNLKPKIKLHFSSEKSPFIIPLFEDRYLIETIKYQVLAAGGLITNSNYCDIEFFVNAPGSEMQEAFDQPSLLKGYEIERNITEFTEQITESVSLDKNSIAVADVAYANGGDIELFNLLKEKNILFKLAGYAGWNTSSNTLGTVITQSMIYNIYKNTQAHKNFLALRYIEDIGYCAILRKLITETVLPNLNLNYFELDGPNGKVSKLIKEKLSLFAEETDKNIKIESCFMPWNRMFEVALDVKYKNTDC